MISVQAIAPAAQRSAVLIDLIGDLDVTLATILSERIESLAARGLRDLFVSTRHVEAATGDGLARLERALADARERGCSISLESGSRRMRLAFERANIACRRDAARPAGSRHLMIAHRGAPGTRPGTDD